MIYHCETHDFTTDSTHEIMDHVNHHAGCKMNETRITSDNADIVSLLIGLSGKPIRFTNVPMERVHAAIALLNDEPQRLTPYGKMLLNASWAARNQDNPAKSSRVEDFTTEELFPRVDKPLNVDGDPCGICRECGAIVSNPVKHVSWHNKTLP